VLSNDSGADPTYLERFRREAKAAARLHNTNIVPVLGVGEDEELSACRSSRDVSRRDAFLCFQNPCKEREGATPPRRAGCSRQLHRAAASRLLLTAIGSEATLNARRRCGPQRAGDLVLRAEVERAAADWRNVVGRSGGSDRSRLHRLTYALGRAAPSRKRFDTNSPRRIGPARATSTTASPFSFHRRGGGREPDQPWQGRYPSTSNPRQV
jgi:hypothetical protein